MADDREIDPIADTELIYRRIPVSMNYWDGNRLSPSAFDPHRNDDTGLSVNRSKYCSVEESARGQSKRGYFVAVLSVASLRRHKIDLAYRPLPENPGHCEIPALTYSSRETSEAEELKVLLSTLVCEIKGPFVPPEVDG